MFKSLLVSASLMFSLSAFADGGHRHSENVCSTADANVCAHLGFHSDLKSTEAGQFIVDIMVQDQVENLQVTLWMPDMGHGTSPVTLSDIGNSHWLVKDAWFVMPGNWVVKLDFVIAGTQHHIEIPVEIAE